MKQNEKIPAIPFREGGDIIHTCQDQYGRILVVDDGGYRILSFDSPFEQSCMKLNHPYRLVHQYTQFMLLALALIEPEHISILGLGGGSLLRTLHHILPNCCFHTIELRKKVVAVAKDYFQIPTDKRVTITVDDALQAVSTIESNTTDIIFSDMYDAYQMVSAQSHEAFLNHCSRILTHQGWLVINMHKLPQDRAAFFERLEALFPTVMLSANQENSVLLLSKRFPDSVRTNAETIESIERLLQQKLSQLIPRLKPINFQFQA